VTDSEAAELGREVARFEDLVEAWISENHPAFK